MLMANQPTKDYDEEYKFTILHDRTILYDNYMTGTSYY